MTKSTSVAPRIWTVFYVVRSPDGRRLQIQKSNDGCTRTVVVR